MVTYTQTSLTWSPYGNGFTADWARGSAQIIPRDNPPPGTAKWKVQVIEAGRVIYETLQFTKDKAQRAAEYNIPK